MAFSSTSVSRIAKYLGYPFTNSAIAQIQSALSSISALTNTTIAAQAEVIIDNWLGDLDTLDAAIATESQAEEGSTTLAELRREYRRHVALVSQATGLPVKVDTAGGSQV